MFCHTVQIAGVRSFEEVRVLEELGVDFIGFPLRLGYHQPDVTEEQAAGIISRMRDPRRAVLITYLASAAEASDLCSHLNASIVQLHGDISPLELRRLRETSPDLRIIKSLIVHPDKPWSTLLDMAKAYESFVDAFITDTYDPKTTASGATGLTHDWKVSRQLASALSKPLILAGGLKPSNVYNAILSASPAAVDAHTGVEGPDGAKSPALVKAFLEEARRAFSSPQKLSSFLPP